jgi:hypothetical protein
VVNVDSSEDGKWHLITAIALMPTGGIGGHLHIYNSDLAASQPEIVCQHIFLFLRPLLFFFSSLVG